MSFSPHCNEIRQFKILSTAFSEQTAKYNVRLYFCLYGIIQKSIKSKIPLLWNNRLHSIVSICTNILCHYKIPFEILDPNSSSFLVWPTSIEPAPTSSTPANKPVNRTTMWTQHTAENSGNLASETINLILPIAFLTFYFILGSLAGDHVRLLPFSSTGLDIDDVSWCLGCEMFCTPAILL